MRTRRKKKTDKPAVFSVCVELQSTHIAIALSSRFNHVGVIAVKKHPTEIETDEERGR